MKKYIVITGVVLIIGLFTAQGFAWMQGKGRGQQTWDRAPQYRMQDNRGYYGNLTEEQVEKLNALHQKFYDETQTLRNDLRTKSTELANILSTKDPDVEKAKAVQREISDIRAKLDEKILEHRIEAAKIVPDSYMGRGYGMMQDRMMRGPGMMGGFGPEMDYDRPMGPRGDYGPSARR